MTFTMKPFQLLAIATIYSCFDFTKLMIGYYNNHVIKYTEL